MREYAYRQAMPLRKEDPALKKKKDDADDAGDSCTAAAAE
jgi:hypothetical protein